jgi:hypothetical protein
VQLAVMRVELIGVPRTIADLQLITERNAGLPDSRRGKMTMGWLSSTLGRIADKGGARTGPPGTRRIDDRG